MKPMVAEGAKNLIPFLRSTNQKVRHYASGALINSALNGSYFYFYFYLFIYLFFKITLDDRSLSLILSTAENEVDLKALTGLSAILNIPDVQLRHNNAWKLKLATFGISIREARKKDEC